MSEEEFKKEILETIHTSLQSFMQIQSGNDGLRERNPLQQAMEELSIRLKTWDKND